MAFSMKEEHQVDHRPSVKPEESPTHEAHSEPDTMMAAAVAFEEGLVPEASADGGVEAFTDQIIDGLTQVLKKYGSTGQFLASRFSQKDSAKEFMDFLHGLSDLMLVQCLNNHCQL